MFVLGLRWLMTVNVSHDYGTPASFFFNTHLKFFDSPIPQYRLFPYVSCHSSILGNIPLHHCEFIPINVDRT
jgi:hypothetical protein